MFWRNPSAAFFNFVLPLLFLALLRRGLLRRPRRTSTSSCPGIAGMSMMSTTFIALAINMTFAARAGHPQAPARHAAAAGGLPRRARRHAVTNTVVQVALVTVAGRFFFGIGWPQDWPALVVFVAARRRLLRVARRRARARDPEPRRGARLRRTPSSCR